ncbi:hypothetical protein [Alishewanella longhuensis]
MEAKKCATVAAQQDNSDNMVLANYTAIMPENILAADRDQIAQFVDALFIHSYDGFVSLRGFDAENKPAGHWRAVPVHEVDQHNKQCNENSNTACKLGKPQPYFAHQLRPFKTERGAGESDLCEGVALSVDIDQGNTLAVADELISISYPKS